LLLVHDILEGRMLGKATRERKWLPAAYAQRYFQQLVTGETSSWKMMMSKTYH